MKRFFTTFICLTIFSFVFLPSVVHAKSDIQEEMIYHILVDRYNIGNQQKSDQVNVDDPYAYHGGDLRGLAAKLGQIQELGYTAISISPIMENAQNGYHGYWVEDFFEIEEQFGTMDDLHRLIKDAEKRNIKVILELPINFIAKSHPFVQDDVKKDWFKENEVKPTDSTYWLEDVVALNQDNPEVAQYLLDVVDFWMDETDIAGFNFHAVDQMSVTFLDELTSHIVNKDSGFYLLGTVLDPNTQIDQKFSDVIVIENYQFYNTLIDVFSEIEAPVSDVYSAWEKLGKNHNLLFVDNEHTKRFSQVVAEKGRNSTTAWKLALTYLYTAPGVPYILQGSELTMYGEGFPETQRLVPFHSAEPDLEQFFYRIASLKKEFPALSHGTFEQIGTNGAMSTFKRSYEGETIYIVINNDSVSQTVELEDVESGKRLRGILGDNLSKENIDGTYTIGAPRESVEVYLIEDDLGFNWWLIGFIATVFSLFVFAVIYLSKKQKARSS